MKKKYNYPHFPSGKWRKALFLMKIKLVLLFCCAGSLSAGPIYSQQTTLDVAYRNQTLVSVFNELKAQMGYNFTYDKEVVNEMTRVTLSMKGATLEQILNKVLTTNGYSYEIDNRIVFVSAAKQQLVQQRPVPVTVKGTVRDSEGRPIMGVTIVVKNMPNFGTTTDVNGVFTLRLTDPANSILIFTYVGKKGVDVTYRGQAEINVTLEDDIMKIDDVVVTGIFTKARESYTGAVTSISKEQIHQYRGQNLIQTLGNIDPSINILQNNDWGSDPNRLPEITIRGRSSLPVNVQELNEGQRNNINTPLIIMDGFEISLQKLMDYNDDEIESINILKDAASTAIYGSRGANGVIVIISKLPSQGRLRINLQASVELEMPDISSYDMLNATEKLQLEKDNGFYSSASPNTQVAYSEIYNKRYRDVIEGTDTDWLSKPLHTGVSQRYNLRLEGGREEFRWGVVTGYNHTEGAMKNSHRNNFSGLISLQYNYRNIMIRNQTSIVLNKSVESNYDSFSEYTKMNPYFNPYDENGELVKTFQAGSERLINIGNPLYNASLTSFDKSKYTEIINNFSIDWTIMEGLVLRGQLGLSKNHGVSDTFVSPLHSSFLTSDYTIGNKILERGRYTYAPSEANNYDAGITLGYTKTFAGKHQLYAGLNYTMLERKESQYKIIGVGFTNEKKNSLGNALSYPTDGRPEEPEDTHIRSLGLTTNVNYTYDYRYYVDVSFRRDGSSQFGSNNRYGNFWSVGAGWNIHRENFLSYNDVIDNLRLKFSYGQTGSQQFSAYDAMRTFVYYSDNRYGSWGAAYLNGFGNEDLKWQITDQFNVGTEIGIFNNRLTATFDFYIKKTSNLLSYVDVPNYTGFGNYITNIGEVKNTGFEASLTVVPIRNGNFTWMLTGKLVSNKDEITHLSEDIKRQNEQYLAQGADVSTLFYEGRSQNAIYVVRSLGIDPASGQEFYLNSYGKTVYEWSATDKVYAGIAEPTHRGNLSTLLRYKNLSLNLSFAFHWGGMAYNQTLINRVEIMRSAMMNQNVDRRVFEDRWSQPGDVASFKGIPAYGESDIQTRATTRFVMNDRVFQMQTASLDYRLDNGWLRKAGIENLRVGINMSDLFYISSVKRERGLEYPFARRVGINFTAMF